LGRGCNLCEGPGRQTRFEITPWEENVHVATDLDALIRLVWAGKVEIILASNLNGLARSSWELVALLREFVSRKIALIIPNQHIDSAKVPRKAFLGMLDAIEEFKRAVAVESVNAGLASARAHGIKLGRPVKISAHRDNVAR
jgi:DNA invertase Pin-like site-specific DNA recombinase